MRKYLLLSTIFILIVYYISTFLISFTLLTKSVVNNDPISLARYINVKDLRNNFYSDIYIFGSNLINIMDKNVSIKSESIEFTGELTTTFFEKLFTRISNNISKDFSSPEIMLYFYFNSNEISTYLNKSFSHFGNYNFKKYLLEIQLKNEENIEINEDKKKAKNIEKEKGNRENILSKLIQRIKSTDYFFLTSPIHFKINVKHQSIPFILILKFNGYIWKIQSITIPYKQLIETKNISLSN